MHVCGRQGNACTAGFVALILWGDIRVLLMHGHEACLRPTLAPLTDTHLPRHMPTRTFVDKIPDDSEEDEAPKKAAAPAKGAAAAAKPAAKKAADSDDDEDDESDDEDDDGGQMQGVLGGGGMRGGLAASDTTPCMGPDVKNPKTLKPNALHGTGCVCLCLTPTPRHARSQPRTGAPQCRDACGSSDGDSPLASMHATPIDTAVTSAAPALSPSPPPRPTPPGPSDDEDGDSDEEMEDAKPAAAKRKADDEEEDDDEDEVRACGRACVAGQG